jgi:diguanylate cyclase (GGDEF)-like protein
MKYTGRLVGVLFVIVNVFLGMHFISVPFHGPVHVLIVIFNMTISYWLGKKYDEAKFYSEKDPLSQVYNRRFVLKLFSSLLSKVNRKNQKLSIFVIDIDNFKDINDQFGHEFGDIVIYEIANSFSSLTRKTDIVARWGGDEFLVIMPFSDGTCLDLLVERINNHLEQISQTLNVAISISIGQSVYPDDAKSLGDLVRYADRLMYEEKYAKRII